MIIKVLEMVFGPAEESQRPAKPQIITPQNFDVAFGEGTPSDLRKLH